MLAERSVIIATTPGIRPLPVVTFCKIPSHALFKLLFIDVPPVERASSTLLLLDRPLVVGVERIGVTHGIRAQRRLSQWQLRKQKFHRGPSSKSDWRLNHAVLQVIIEFSTEQPKE